MWIAPTSGGGCGGEDATSNSEKANSSISNPQTRLGPRNSSPARAAAVMTDQQLEPHAHLPAERRSLDRVGRHGAGSLRGKRGHRWLAVSSSGHREATRQRREEREESVLRSRGMKKPRHLRTPCGKAFRQTHLPDKHQPAKTDQNFDEAEEAKKARLDSTTRPGSAGSDLSRDSLGGSHAVGGTHERLPEESNAGLAARLMRENTRR